jgi:hypothetical protein
MQTNKVITKWWETAAAALALGIILCAGAIMVELLSRRTQWVIAIILLALGIILLVRSYKIHKDNQKQEKMESENKIPSIAVTPKIIEKENPFDKPNSQLVLEVVNTGGEAVFVARAKTKGGSAFFDLPWDDGADIERKIYHGDNTHFVNLSSLGSHKSTPYINLLQSGIGFEGERRVLYVPNQTSVNDLELEVEIHSSPPLLESFHRFYKIRLNDKGLAVNEVDEEVKNA